MSYLVGVSHEWGCNLVYVPFKDKDWFFPFVTKTKGDGLHSRIIWVNK